MQLLARDTAGNERFSGHDSGPFGRVGLFHLRAERDLVRAGGRCNLCKFAAEWQRQLKAFCAPLISTPPDLVIAFVNQGGTKVRDIAVSLKGGYVRCPNGQDVLGKIVGKFAHLHHRACD